MDTLGTGWYNYGLSLKSRGIWIPRGLVSPSKTTGVGRIPRRLRKVVLESWYDTRRGSGVSRHNSREFPTGYSWNTNSPVGGKGGPGGLELHQTRAESGPRAWYYTRHGLRSGPGGLVLHQGGWDRSDPRGDDWLNTNGC